MITGFKTETGSKYEIDPIGMTWRRIRKTDESGEIRNESGHLLRLPAVIIGSPVMLVDDTVQPGYDGHAVWTSRVTEITESI